MRHVGRRCENIGRMYPEVGDILNVGIVLLEPPYVHGHLTGFFLVDMSAFPFYLILALNRKEGAIAGMPEVIRTFLVVMVRTLTLETKEETKLLHGTLKLLGRNAKGEVGTEFIDEDLQVEVGLELCQETEWREEERRCIGKLVIWKFLLFGGGEIEDGYKSPDQPWPRSQWMS